MLSEQDKRRIESEEAYRASVRRRHGPVQTTSFRDKVAKAEFWANTIVWGGAFIAFLYFFS